MEGNGKGGRKGKGEGRGDVEGGIWLTQWVQNAKLLLSLRVKVKEKTNNLKPVFWLLCNDFLESREVAKVTKIKT